MLPAISVHTGGTAQALQFPWLLHQSLHARKFVPPVTVISALCMPVPRPVPVSVPMPVPNSGRTLLTCVPVHMIRISVTSVCASVLFSISRLS